MHYEVRFSVAAERSLERLERYLSRKFYPDAAAAYAEAIYRHCISLQTFPVRGTSQPDFGPDVRLIGFQQTVNILFRVDSDRRRVIILRISYRGRSIRL